MSRRSSILEARPRSLGLCQESEKRERAELVTDSEITGEMLNVFQF